MLIFLHPPWSDAAPNSKWSKVYEEILVLLATENEEGWDGISQCLHYTCHWDQGTFLSRSHWFNLLHSTACNYPVWLLDGGNTSLIHIRCQIHQSYNSQQHPQASWKCLHICTVKACSLGQASCLHTSDGQVRMPFHKAWELIRTLPYCSHPMIGDVWCCSWCKLPDLKESKTS